MPRPRIQFCPQGHDTFTVGRNDSGRCLECANKRSDPSRTRPENAEHVREADRERARRRRQRTHDEIVAVRLCGSIEGQTAMALREECARRGGIKPEQLAREILAIVIRDNLFAAVLDS